jgi:hypothetical protein
MASSQEDSETLPVGGSKQASESPDA